MAGSAYLDPMPIGIPGAEPLYAHGYLLRSINYIP